METQKCFSCDDLLTEEANCTVCSQSLHFHCAGITEAGYRRLGDRRNTWRCHKCKQSGTTTAQPLSSPKSPRPEAESAVLMEIRALAAKLTPLEGLKDEVSALRSEFADWKMSLQKQFDDMAVKFSAKIEHMEQRIAQLEKVELQVDQLQARLDRLDQESNTGEQWARMNNVEIKGVPQSGKENLFEILTKIGTKIQYPVNKTQINFITRVPTREKDNTKPIVICFCNRYVKEDFIAAARLVSKSNPLTAAQIGYPDSHKIYVDHLTIQNKALLAKTKKAAKEMNFQYVWVKHAKIHVRKQENSNVIVVKTEKDLAKIM